MLRSTLTQSLFCKAFSSELQAQYGIELKMQALKTAVAKPIVGELYSESSINRAAILELRALKELNAKVCAKALLKQMLDETYSQEDYESFRSMYRDGLLTAAELAEREEGHLKFDYAKYVDVKTPSTAERKPDYIPDEIKAGMIVEITRPADIRSTTDLFLVEFVTDDRQYMLITSIDSETLMFERAKTGYPIRKTFGSYNFTRSEYVIRTDIQTF